MKNSLFLYLINSLLFFLTITSCSNSKKIAIETEPLKRSNSSIPIIFDTDANNELDDQHALAYLLFNGPLFDVKGITVNATYNGGDIEEQYAEARRVMDLCAIQNEIPLLKGVNGSFDDIRNQLQNDSFDGIHAIQFIIEEARKERPEKLVVLAVGKLTNIALALEKAPDIIDKIRLVWLGSNYPKPGEYNQENDLAAVNYILSLEVPFEMVSVRYGEPSGSDVVKVTPTEIQQKLAGKGPKVQAVIGRKDRSFTRFGDYAASLFEFIELYGDPPGRALFDMVAVAILKDENWGQRKVIPAPILVGENWEDQPSNKRKITIWENFNKAAILDDFFKVLKNPILFNRSLTYKKYLPKPNDIVISRKSYQNKLYGFWLAQCIANWTGLITEMDKIGGAGKDGKGAGFYTRLDWGQPDQPNLWGSNNYAETIDFLVEKEGGIWGADDDTDIEYIYQELLYENTTSHLTGEQIREGWLRHIKREEENYLWVSNQTAFDLMQKGFIPPATSHPDNNPHYEMIDAQLTTEIFGFFAPTRPDIARKMATLPIQTTARENAEWIAQFYVTMYALAPTIDENKSLKPQLFTIAETARQQLPENSYAAKMYDFVKNQYENDKTWEAARDALHEKYQIRQEDGYEWATKDEVCNGCFAAGINFGASIVSLFYGEGDLKETIKIGVLAGWDSDNPTATWGGLLGFILGKAGVEVSFDKKFAHLFNIHRTRINFPNNGIDDFDNMARKGMYIIDRVVQEELGGGVDLEKDVWYIPL